MKSNAAKVIPVSNAAGGDGGGDDMETRVAKLEIAVGTMQQDIAIIKATCATKSELADLKTDLKGDMHTLREELKGDMHTLREELKGDMHKLREELKEDMHKLREELKRDIHGVKEQLKDVQVDFYKAITEQTKSQNRWSLGLLITIAIGFAGLLLKH